MPLSVTLRRRLLLPVAVASAALAGAAAVTASAQAPAAPAADYSFTFQGRGWGHGVGMSQWGAYGRARAGWDAARILRHYYRGTRLSVVRQRVVRVLLDDAARSAAVRSESAWRAIGVRPSGRRVTPLRPRTTYRVRMLAGGRLALQLGRRRVAVFTGAVRLQPRRRSGVVSWGPRRPEAERSYRGGLRAVPDGRTFQLVNLVRLEDYLKGVVPREMPASWGDRAAAALVAQAVAARSYALATMSPTATYDVYDDTRSQAYGGVAGEDPRTTSAVEATRGTVLTYDGAVIPAYFFSTSGGRTENVENVFRGSGQKPYLVSVPDPYDRYSPYHRWSDPPTFTGARLGRLLGLGGPVVRVDVLRRGVSPRVVDAAVVTSAGRRVTVSGATMRSSLGLRDTWFSVTRSVTAAAAGR
jgi:stage II sporulation protein D